MNSDSSSHISIYINKEGNGIDICLDTSKSYVGEWITGEGGDICLYRDIDTGKVTGAYLPLTSDKLSVWTDGPLRINEGF